MAAVVGDLDGNYSKDFDIFIHIGFKGHCVGKFSYHLEFHPEQHEESFSFIQVSKEQ